MNWPIPLLVMSVLLTGCGEQVSRDEKARVLAMGDSMLAWHRAEGKSIIQTVEERLDEEVVDRSVVGAQFTYFLPISGALGMNIGKQYRPGKWDWVILNGGAMIFGFPAVASNATGWSISWFERPEDRKGCRHHSQAPRRRIPGHLRRLSAQPGVNSLVDHCKDEDIGVQISDRGIRREGSGVHYLQVSGLVPAGDAAFMHPTASTRPARRPRS